MVRAALLGPQTPLGASPVTSILGASDKLEAASLGLRFVPTVAHFGEGFSRSPAESAEGKRGVLMPWGFGWDRSPFGNLIIIMKLFGHWNQKKGHVD